LSSGAEAPVRYLRVGVWIGFALAFVVALLIAPDLSGGNSTRFGSFFATSAQVVAALLVVLAVGVTAASFRGLDLRRRDLIAGMSEGCVALVAALTALSPSLPSWVYEPCFAVTVAGGLGSLITVLMLGVKAIDQAKQGATEEVLVLRASMGDTAAVEELARRGIRLGQSSGAASS
jgi:hypothetical protein